MKRERLARNLVIADGVVKCRIKRAGKFCEWTAPYQGRSAYSEAADGSKKLKTELLKWLADCEKAIAEKRWEAIRSTHIRGGSATIGSIIAAYQKAAEHRRAVSGTPTEHSVRLAVGRLRQISSAMGFTDADPLESMTHEKVDRWVESRVREYTTPDRPREKAVATAAALLNSARGVFARWACEEYRRNNIALPECVKDWPRPAVTWKPQYRDPPRSLKMETMRRAAELKRSNPKVWILFHVLISFGCRPGDALRLTTDNFQMLQGADKTERRYLVYRPNKTSNKNAKQVIQPVSDRVWNELEQVRKQVGGDEDFIVPTMKGHRGRATALEALNAWLRDVGWSADTYRQGAYNLRGLFTSAVLNTFGEQVASDYSGSSLPMIRRHYGALYVDRLPEIDAVKVITG